MESSVALKCTIKLFQDVALNYVDGLLISLSYNVYAVSRNNDIANPVKCVKNLNYMVYIITVW